MSRHLPHGLALLVWMFCGPALAETTDWSLCSSTPPAPLAVTPGTQGEPRVFLHGERSLSDGATYHELSGDVLLEYDGQRLTADRVRYDAARRVADAEGDLHYTLPGLQLDAERARLDLARDEAEAGTVRYWISDAHGRGEAEQAALSWRNVLRLTRMSYTTCEPGQEDWRLRARTLTLSRSEGWGVAHHAHLELGDVPVLYLPWISFPLDERRKTGLLLPGFGHADTTGFFYNQPYYWNIAPNHDATFTPRLMSERGVMIGAEYRYLYPGQGGELDVEYLPNDRRTDQERSLFRALHNAKFGPRLRASLRYAEVSDDEFFEDLAGGLELASITHLERYLQAGYEGDSWRLSARAEDFQTLSGKDPYRRLPQVLFNGALPARPLGLEFALDSEYVHFDHEDDIVRGTRLDLDPYVALPLRTASSFLTPALHLRHTRYDLDDAAPGADSAPTRSAPVASVDSGLIFERDMNLGGQALRQTLEPRLYYLYVPERSQDELPVFDSAELDFGFGQLFRPYRFSGADRLGDANQATLALSSRVLDRGSERARLGLAYIHYFNDPQVTLPGVKADADLLTNYAAEAALRLAPGWSAGGALFYDSDAGHTGKGTLRLRYQPEAGRLLHLAYRFRAGALEQTDLALLWPVTPRWRGIARWNYALDTREPIEMLAGIERGGCCLAWRLAFRSYVNGTPGERNDAVLFELELKGLGSAGQNFSTLMDRATLTYD
jgi:LPS-assembly protein